MGVLSRLYRLCKADVHGVMDQLEDKELLLKQYLREMEENLKQKEACLVRTDETIRQIQGNLSLRREELQKLEKDLDHAVGMGKDGIARILIRKRRTLQSGVELLEQGLQRLEEERCRIQETLHGQRLQYDQLKVQVAGFCRQMAVSSPEGLGLPPEGPWIWKAPTEEEIELELLERKQLLQQGGAQ